tara:strand:+ start:305 stop:1747 length:1443 start_codon:yes stop_codon:yes gene_type:complete
MSLTGKTLESTYHGLLKVSTADNQNLTTSLQNIVDGEDTPSCLSLTKNTGAKAVLSVDGDNAAGTSIQIDNSAGDGDVSLEYQLNGTTIWVMGVEDGDSDNLKICHDSTLGSDERLTFGATATVFNEDGSDIDFRVESNGSANMIYVDAGSDEIGIGTGSPAAKIHIYDNAANVGANGGILIEQDHASGDAGLTFLISGTEQYLMGIDQSDSNRFKICEDSSFDNLNCLTIDTSNNIGFGVPNGVAIPGDAAVYRASGDLNFVIKGAAGSSNAGALLDLDCGHHGEYTYVRFLTAGDVRGQIYYDSDSTAADEEMVFYVNDAASYALRLSADADGPKHSMGGAPGTETSLEIVGRSFNGRVPLKLYDDGTGTHHGTANMYHHPIANAVQIPVDGTMDIEVTGGSFYGMLAGEDGMHICFSGYCGSAGITTLQSWNAVNCNVAGVSGEKKIRLQNTDATPNRAIGFIWTAGGTAKIVAQST